MINNLSANQTLQSIYMTVIVSSLEGHFNEAFMVKAGVIQLPLSLTRVSVLLTETHIFLKLLTLLFKG